MFSAVVPAYNAGRFIHDAVSSILSQDLPASEVIVVNDGSTDNTAEVLASFGDRIKVIEIENSGPSTARNVGVNAAIGEWIAFLDADDRWWPGHLNLLESWINEHPGAGLIHTDEMVIDEEGKELKPMHTKTDRRETFCSILLDPTVTTSATAVRRSCFDGVGMFLPGLKSGQDWDLWLRIARLFPVIHVPQISIYYRRHSGGIGHTRGLAKRDDNLFIVSRAAAEATQLPESLLRRARANCYLESAVRMLVTMDTAQARRDIMSALREYPLLPKAWVLLMVALGGPKAAQAAVAWRRRREGRV